MRVFMCSCECMSVCAPTCLSVCLCDCCCKCVYARFACVCACMHTITAVDDAWIGIICHNVAKQDVRYYCIVVFIKDSIIASMLALVCSYVKCHCVYYCFNGCQS